MSTNSETILPTQTHPGDSSVIEITGDAYRGDGYYSRADGLHTLQISYENLIGTVSIQATLATDPAESDWFTVYENSVFEETTGNIVNITGNYVYVRALLSYTQGTLNRILLNH